MQLQRYFPLWQSPKDPLIQLSHCLLRHTQCVLISHCLPHTVCPACKPHYVPKLLVTSCPYCSYCISLNSHCLLPPGVTCVCTVHMWRPVFPLLVTWSAGLPLGAQQVARPSNKQCEKYWAGSIYIHATPSGNKQWSPSGEMVSNKDENASRQQYAPAGSETHRHTAGWQTHAALNACIVTCFT